MLKNEGLNYITSKILW